MLGYVTSDAKDDFSMKRYTKAFAYAAMAVVDDRTRQLSMGGTNGVYADSQSLCLLGCAIYNRCPECPGSSRMANVADVCLIKISMNIIV